MPDIMPIFSTHAGIVAGRVLRKSRFTVNKYLGWNHQRRIVNTQMLGEKLYLPGTTHFVIDFTCRQAGPELLDDQIQKEYSRSR